MFWRIGRSIAAFVRTRFFGPNLEAGYREMAKDMARETEARESSEATIGDVLKERDNLIR